LRKIRLGEVDPDWLEKWRVRRRSALKRSYAKNKYSVCQKRQQYYKQNKEEINKRRRQLYQKNKIKIKLRRIELEIMREENVKECLML